MVAVSQNNLKTIAVVLRLGNENVLGKVLKLFVNTVFLNICFKS